jgi:hypothetical protein
MRTVLVMGLAAALLTGVGAGVSSAGQAPKQPPKEPPRSSPKDTPAAELTRTKLLKTPVTVGFANAVPLGEVLKEFAKQVDDASGEPVMWAYGAGFPHSQKVLFACKNMPLDAALDELFTKVGKAGYIVIASEGNKYDGWVWLTNAGERGREKGKEPGK